jgi:predicted PurR-regulated permease PerM
MKAVIIPLVLTIIIYFMLYPILSFSERKNIPDIITILVIISLTVVILFSIGHMINKNVESFSENIEYYEGRFKSKVNDVGNFLSVTKKGQDPANENISELKPLSVLLSDYKT